MVGDIVISVEGKGHAGKGYVIAAIAHKLRELGINVSIQGEETHNKEKIEKDDAEIANKLKEKECRVVILEMQTS